MTKLLTSLVQHDKVISKFDQQQLVIDELDALLRVPRQLLYWEALAILQLS